MEETGSVHSEDFLQPNKVEEKQIMTNRREGVKSDTSNGKLYYPTGSGYIVNAATGFVYPYKMGTVQEKQFWRVMRSVTREGITDGIKTFYESPEQYEMHVGIEIDHKFKEHWRKITRAHMSEINKPKKTSESIKQTYTFVK